LNNNHLAISISGYKTQTAEEGNGEREREKRPSTPKTKENLLDGILMKCE